jgi:hypothetical protein
MAVLSKPVIGGPDAPSFNPAAYQKAMQRMAGRAPGFPASTPTVVNGPAYRHTPGVAPQAPAAAQPRVFTVGAEGGGNKFSNTPHNPYQTAVANVNAGGTGVTATPKSATQNSFLKGIQDVFQRNQPARQNSLTQFVRDAYAGQEGNRKAMEQEGKALDQVFSDSGLVDELANSRAQRKAAVMVNTKLAMDRARRGNNVNRMMGGNNSYLDRAYGDTLARIAYDGAVQDSDLLRDDIRYVQGERMGALGGRQQLLNNFLQTSAMPMRFQNEMFQNDLQAGQGMAALENQNTIYRTPYDRMMEEIRMAEGMDFLNQRANPQPAFTPVSSYSPPPAPVRGPVNVHPQQMPPMLPMTNPRLPTWLKQLPRFAA